MKVYYEEGKLRIRSMIREDAKIYYDTYLSYDWHPQMEIYENYFKDQEEGKRLVFVPEYEGKVAGICTLLLAPKEGPFVGNGWPEINDFTTFFHLHKKGIGNKVLDVVESEAAKIADHVYLAVGVHSGYGAAQRIYAKRGYIPDGSGVWYQGKQLEQYAPCVNDDDLLLFLAKDLKRIELRKMNPEEYKIFYDRSFKHHVRELMEEEHMSLEEAEKETANELADMLPDGLGTVDNYLMSIHRSDDDAWIGFIWTLHEMTEGVKQSFICDFEIFEDYRRKGYAAETLSLMEKAAGEACCAESVLFVTKDNVAANALYEKCGYQFLRDMEYGRYMKKKLCKKEPR